MNFALLFVFLVCNCIAADVSIITIPEQSTGFDLKQFVHKYQWEVLGLVLLIVYGMYFISGRKKNFSIVENWLNHYLPLLQKNFTSVGISGNYGMFMRESFDQFRFFCSGRKNCNGILFDFKMKKRQDLFSLLLDFITPVDDIMTVDIPVDPKVVKPFLFALCRKRDYESVHSSNGDLKNMGHPVAMQYTPELHKASGNWVIISDTNEIPSSLLTPALMNILKVPNSLLRLVHVSDHMTPPDDNRVHLSDTAIRIKVKLPTYDRMEAIEDIMNYIMTVCDDVAEVKISPKAAAAITKARSILSEKQQREEHKLRQKRMQQMKEQKLKEQKERAERLSPKAQAKLEEKLEKEEKKKQMKKRVRLIR